MLEVNTARAPHKRRDLFSLHFGRAVWQFGTFGICDDCHCKVTEIDMSQHNPRTTEPKRLWRTFDDDRVYDGAFFCRASFCWVIGKRGNKPCNFEHSPSGSVRSFELLRIGPSRQRQCYWRDRSRKLRCGCERIRRQRRERSHDRSPRNDHRYVANRPVWPDSRWWRS
jgi:hypothetical protein